MRVVLRVALDLQFNIPTIPAGFTVAHRLLRKGGFGHVVHAENVEDKYFKVFFVRNDQKNARLGISARKKILSGAVHRNRAKRVIREAFRRHNIKACKLDVVVVVRRGYAQECAKCATRSDGLGILFSRIKNRCVKLQSS